MRSLTWQQVIGWRLRRGHLTPPAFGGRFADLAGAVAGVQAQVMSAAELSLGVRTDGLDLAGLHEEFWQRRMIAKTYGPRETLHVLPTAELPLWMAAMWARQAAEDVPWYVRWRLTPGQARELVGAIGAALDRRTLTREELAAAVAGQVGDWARGLLASSWGELLPPAAYEGLLCYGPSRGAKVTFTRADQWSAASRTAWKPAEPEAGLRHVARRFLAAYGPAAPRDFARWFGVKPEFARGLFARMGGELAEAEVAGRRVSLLASDEDSLYGARPAGDALALLPQYDCYILGSHPREHIVPEHARKRIFSYGRGRFEGAVALNVLIADGVVAGIWERRKKGKRYVVRVEPFIELGPARRKHVAYLAEAIAAFVHCDLDFSWGRLD